MASCAGAVSAPAACGAEPVPLSLHTPNVLLVGDSISALSSGYLGQLERVLSPGLATVQHVSTGALTSSADAVQCIDSWLGNRKWDVVVIAIGLGDCRPTNTTDTDNVSKSASSDAGSTFLANLKQIVAAAEASSGPVAVPVIYATATPFDTSTVHSVSASCVKANNQAARAAMPAMQAATAGARCPTDRVADLELAVEQYCTALPDGIRACRIQNDGSLLFNTTDSRPSGLYVVHRALRTAMHRKRG